MKIHILTAVWKRPEITRICFEGIKRLGLEATAAISEDAMIPLCEEYGIDWVMVHNTPVGNKWNAGMKEALKKEWDYVMILGSDDIVSDSLLERYKPLMGRYYMFGADSCYLYYKGEVKRIQSEMSIGAGRMLHRSLVEDCFPFWPAIDRSLDGGSLRRIRAKGYDEHVIPLGDAIILDIKSDTNLNAYERLKGEKAELDLSCFPVEKKLLESL